ncbi:MULTISPECIES: hypothetical protein [unclassified Paraburkholderia]|nr:MULTISPECIES: hypothetical protein [unclassified Paraburkholderia]
MIEETWSHGEGMAIGKIASPHTLRQGTFYLHFGFISRRTFVAAQSSA